eukprot:GHVQ01034397.1.p1 GENE.GHVQ01034397.1~~GHVQ01034397.1.p1  ORF type:complete len:342 (-),score=14.49 GHVQ01034397.1:127-1152(-)
MEDLSTYYADPSETYNAIASRLRLQWIAEFDQENPNWKGTQTIVFGLERVGFHGSVGNALLIGIYNGKLSACRTHEILEFLWGFRSAIDGGFAHPVFKKLSFFYDESLHLGHPDKCLDFLFSQTPITFCMTVDMMRLLSKLCGTGWDDQNVLERMTSVEYYLAIGKEIEEAHLLGVVPPKQEEVIIDNPRHKQLEVQPETLRPRKNQASREYYTSSGGRKGRTPTNGGGRKGRTPTNGGGRKIWTLPEPAPPMVPWGSDTPMIDDAGTTSVSAFSPSNPPVFVILSFGLIIAVLYVALPTGIFRSLWRWFICLIKYLKTLATLSTRKRKIHARPRKPKTKK